MWGTFLNVAGIVIGGIVGLTSRRQPSTTQQVAWKALLAALMVFVGLRLTWISLGDTVGQMGRQLLVVLLALIMGRVTGRLLGLQKLHNRLGRYARERLADTKLIGPQRFNEGFLVSTVLFCATPLGFLGAVQDGLGGHWQALGVKAVLEGLTATSLVRTFGSSVLLAVAPVVAYQGTVTLGARWLWTLAPDPALADAVNATGGLLVFSAALLLLSIRKIEVADYLPSLAFAPLLKWVLG